MENEEDVANADNPSPLPPATAASATSTTADLTAVAKRISMKSSQPFTAPENKLLSELYLANKSQYHAKSRASAGDKANETSQERFAAHFAQELSKLGFATRTTAQVKQRIADIRKLGHKLIIKQREKGSESKKKKKVFVEEWLKNIMKALEEEFVEEAAGRSAKRARAEASSNEDPTLDAMSRLAQKMVDCHREGSEDPTQDEHIVVSNRHSPLHLSSPSVSDNAMYEVEEPGRSNALELPLELLPDAVIKRRLMEAELRVVLKKEKLLDLQIRKAEADLAIVTGQMTPSTRAISTSNNGFWRESREASPISNSSRGAAATAQVNEGQLINGDLLRSVKAESVNLWNGVKS